VTVAASYGALVQSSVRHSRILDTDVRVGDYKLDSTHTIRSNDFDFSSVTAGHPVALPLSDDASAVANGGRGARPTAATTTPPSGWSRSGPSAP
jgi:hypothetical protein